MEVTLTWTSGFSFSKSRINSGNFSPSLPIPHKFNSPVAGLLSRAMEESPPPPQLFHYSSFRNRRIQRQ